jgi:hypothetical protein
MKWVLIGVALLVLLVGTLFLIGLLLPREHRATCRARFRAAPQALFDRLADVESYPRWRSDVRSAKRIALPDGGAGFVEETGEGPRTYAVDANEPPLRRVTRVADEDLFYGGTWTFTLVPDGSGTALSITEDGFVKPALFRTLARFVFGHHTTMARYLDDLARGLGESVTVERS